VLGDGGVPVGLPGIIEDSVNLKLGSGGGAANY
jgi:hypothetical protein